MKTPALLYSSLVLGWMLAGPSHGQDISLAAIEGKGPASDSAKPALAVLPREHAFLRLFKVDAKPASDSFPLLGDATEDIDENSGASDGTHRPTLSKVGVSRKSNVFVLRPDFPGKSGADLMVTDVFGKKIMSGRWRSRAFRLDLSHQPKGVYFLHLTGAENTKALVRIRVE